MDIFFKIKNNIFYIKENSLSCIEEYFLKKRIVQLNSEPLILDISYNEGKSYKKILNNFKPTLIIGLESNLKLINESYEHQKIKKLNYIVSTNCNDEKNL